MLARTYTVISMRNFNCNDDSKGKDNGNVVVQMASVFQLYESEMIHETKIQFEQILPDSSTKNRDVE